MPKKVKPSTIADPFRATGAELKAAAEAGDPAAVAEIERRKARRAEKAAARAA